MPVFVNTFYEPNPPTARRCYEFGVALGAAIRASRDLRVGVVASGGLGHFVIDEDLDRGFMEALTAKDPEFMVSLEDDLLRSGTSEYRNWVVVAGRSRAAAHRAGRRLSAVLPVGGGHRLRHGLHGLAAMTSRDGPRKPQEPLPGGLVALPPCPPARAAAGAGAG